MSEKQYLRVLRAVKDGAETSREVADDVGISLGIASAQLAYLANEDLVEWVGEFWHHDGNRKFKRWRVTEAGARAI